ncbi:MAG: tRNA pseudouridine(55) synthase TruB [Pseudohongiellaceae bacterium]
MARQQRKNRKSRGRRIHGIVVLDKAAGISSNGALQEVKRLFEANKAGHTGSLDPLATGVLPLCLGEATKLSQFLLESDKRYHARVRLGIRTDSGDSEGKVIAECADFTVAKRAVEKALKNFAGEIEQLPPMHSALKVDGVPLYKLAHAGKTVERRPRMIMVHHIKLLKFDSRELELDIACGKGTYIRTIADDLGQMLGCGAHINALRRTAVGDFTEADCMSLERLEQEKEHGGLEQLDAHIVPMDKAVARLPEVVLPEITASCVKNGQPVLVRHLPEEGLVRLYEAEQFIGIGHIDDDGRVAPKRLIRLL